MRGNGLAAAHWSMHFYTFAADMREAPPCIHGENACLRNPRILASSKTSLRMSWLLFLDESGTDHSHSPYEVRGGVAIHASQIWPLVQRLQSAELEAFGTNLREYRKELKGSKLLDKDRFEGFTEEDYLRKDLVFLLERFFYFLERRREHGLLVLDQIEKSSDQRFVRQMERYFTKTKSGRSRASTIVPAPLFVASDMTLPVQAADLAIYCVNRGFRLPRQGMDKPARPEIAKEFGPWLKALQYKDRVEREGRVFDSYGILFVPNPYGGGRYQSPKKEKEAKPTKPPSRSRSGTQPPGSIIAGIDE